MLTGLLGLPDRKAERVERRRIEIRRLAEHDRSDEPNGSAAQDHAFRTMARRDDEPRSDPSDQWPIVRRHRTHAPPRRPDLSIRQAGNELDRLGHLPTDDVRVDG